MKRLLFFIIVISSLAAQNYRGGFKYRFNDSSTPPQYHRSYVINIEDTIVNFVIDSYQNILFEETFSITAKQLEDFIKGVKACKIKIGKVKEEPNGCTGGTSDAFYFLWEANVLKSGYRSKCGGKEYGSIKGKVDALRALFKSMVPDFSGKMERTRN